jgi:pyruvate kinase
MHAIAAATEAELYPFDRCIRPAPTRGSSDRLVARMSARAAHDADASAIVVFSRSGRTAAELSDERPRCPIVALTDDAEVRARLALVWGVRALAPPAARSGPERIAAAGALVIAEGLSAPGDRVVVAFGDDEDPSLALSARVVDAKASG